MRLSPLSPRAIRDDDCVSAMVIAQDGGALSPRWTGDELLSRCLRVVSGLRKRGEIRDRCSAAFHETARRTTNRYFSSRTFFACCCPPFSLSLLRLLRPLVENATVVTVKYDTRWPKSQGRRRYFWANRHRVFIREDLAEVHLRTKNSSQRTRTHDRQRYNW